MSTPITRARRGIAVAASLATVSSGAVLAAMPAHADLAVSPDIVIAEVYGAGGNVGALYNQDFIELYNTGDDTVDVDGWSVQYASAGGSSWTNKINLVGQIPPGFHYLVGGFSGAEGVPLPTPDVTGSINMSGTAGKVALVTTTTALTGCGATGMPSCTLDPNVRDYLGYGTSATDYETAPTSNLSVTLSADRDAAGTDTDHNANDFNPPGTPNPQNCGEECEDGEEPPIGTPLDIAEIQGVGHLSDDQGVLAETTGVTTARSGTGYWIQDPDGDDDPRTSEGIFVFTGSGGAKPNVGDAVTVTGTVDEFRPGSATGPGLNITELTDSTFVVTEPGADVPAPVVIGPGGVLPPADVIDNDSETRIDIEVNGTYDPNQDAIDWYEQYEGMLLQLNAPTAVGPTNSFGEIVVLPKGKHEYVRSINKGVVYSSYDNPNPRRLVLDDVIIGAGNMPNANTGDKINGAVVGPLDYGFNNWRVYPLTAPTVTAGDTERSSAEPAPARQLAVATFNVENLDPTDPQSKFDDLAEIVVDHLASPDVLALEEVQDNTGAVNDGAVDASQTLDQFVAAISAAGGPAYEYTQINPEDGEDGGEPGGNIRVAFLYRTDRGVELNERGEGDATTPTEVTEIGGEAALTLSPGRVDPTNPAWEATRKPLAAEFTWRGEKLFVIANHFSSKGGDEPLFGRWQPPTRSSEVKRQQQAASVNGFVQDLLDVDPDANIAVVGDINDFEFSGTVDALTDGGEDLADLIQYLKPGERYTYVFEGNSQVLDHILVGPSLAPAGTTDAKPVRPRRDYDVVHVNADFWDQVSDHDPQVVRLRFGSGSPVAGR